MATWDNVRRIALALPEVEETGGFGSEGWVAWKVRGKPLAFERPLRKSDLAALGDAAPAGDILGIRTVSLDAKEAALAQDPACFTIPHFDGYAAVLVRLADASDDLLEELITDIWRARAPKRVVAAWDAERAGADQS